MDKIKELQSRIVELEAELKVSDELLKDRDALLSAIPECTAHGKCVPHAIEWIEQVKTLASIVAGSNQSGLNVYTAHFSGKNTRFDCGGV